MRNTRGKSLPYLVHTNRELGLMLSGQKPLAVFVDGKDCFPDVVLRYLRLFDRQVAAGRIVRHDHFSAAPPSCRCNSIHHILFALPGEEWRIPAMLELVLADTKWTAAHERKQGALLGYADWMNAWWVEHVFGR